MTLLRDSAASSTAGAVRAAGPVALDLAGAAQSPARLTDPADLRALMGTAFSVQQLDAITAPLEPGVIVAGAGSGKTTVMAARVVWLVGSGALQPDQVLGLTFTNKAAAELRIKVRRALIDAGLGGHSQGRPGHHTAVPETAELPEDSGEPAVATYHAFAGRLIAEHGLRLGVEPDTRVSADASRFQLAVSVLHRHRGRLQHVSTHLPTLVTDLLNLDAQLSEHVVGVDDVRRFHTELRRRLAGARPTKRVDAVAAAAAKRDELLDLVAAYRDAKEVRGVMDFSDQMALGAALAERCAEVGETERDRYRVVLLDEYQDTSVAQRRMLAGLFSGSTTTDGRGWPVTAVGDPCQAIYGWRGASVANLDEFPEHFRRDDGTAPRRFPLSVNRRSGQRILEAANDHAAPLYKRHRGVEPLRAPAGVLPGEVSVALLDSHRAEMAWVAGQVAAAKADDERLAWSDIAALVHDNADAAHLQVELRHHGIPVELVGLGGLLTRPEVADVVATLEVTHDLTANPALLRLLTGPRWRIGARDLALLGRRARHLASYGSSGPAAHPAASPADGLAHALEAAVAGADPTEIASLSEAIEDPGPGPYSAEARQRFRLLWREIRALRRSVGEPLIDLVRRVVDATGLAVELSSSSSPVGTQAADNVAAFLDAVAAYAGVDAEASLPGLLAYLRAEDEFGHGLAVAAPSDADSVKLMTVHKAKGLEWDVVFLPALAKGVFPSTRPRSRWTTSAKELPWPLRGDAATLVQVGDWTPRGLDEFVAEARADDLLEERRLGYVALTRARRRLIASGHWWGRTQKNRRGPSDYLLQLLAEVQRHGEAPVVWADEPGSDTANPELDTQQVSGWPADLDVGALEERRDAAELVAAARRRHRGTGSYESDDELADLMLDEQARVQAWDDEIERLLVEARAARSSQHVVELPATLSATAMMRLHSEPQSLARDLLRPMPRRPSPAARFGTRFHAWVEAFVGQQPLLGADDIPGAGDVGIGSDAELQQLCDAFRSGPFAERIPYQVEAPFALVLGGQVVRGRIDAVYATRDGFQVVDWKTNVEQSADPLQLALYRVAWAELSGVAPERVTAAFYYVRTGDLISPDELPGRAELEALLQLDDDPSA